MTPNIAEKFVFVCMPSALASEFLAISISPWFWMLSALLFLLGARFIFVYTDLKGVNDERKTDSAYDDRYGASE